MATGTNSLELVVLGLLKEHDMHGYELKKHMSESLEPIMRVSWGSLYPALARLEARGAVKAVEARSLNPVIPMTGSLGGEKAAFRTRTESPKGSRNKKVYGITELGLNVFDEMMNEDSPIDDKSFAIRLAFAKYLEPENRLKMLNSRRDQILAKVKSNGRSTEKKRYALEPYVELVLEHFRSTNTSDLAWIEELIEKEKTALQHSRNQRETPTEIQGSL